MADQRSFLFLLSSGRRDGNAQVLAERAAKVLAPDVTQTWIDLADCALAPFEDTRHSSGIHPLPTGKGKELLDATLLSSDLVFVAPVYWYGLPSAAKLYLDHWTHWLRLPGLDFKPRFAGKTLWAISMLSDRDLPQAEPLLQSLRLTAAYMKAKWGGSVVGYGNRPGDVLQDKAALADADRLFAVGGDLASSFKG